MISRLQGASHAAVEIPAQGENQNLAGNLNDFDTAPASALQARSANPLGMEFAMW
ncbi:MAG: hypothetical protein J0H27_02015 [Xanthomonadales bacterium]|nr:hypothetical protein [Xanthomonadales bacterium]